ncbi:TPR-like protein [Scenedesmus sp. NREL 46B-D3]|nr:TPR-like protein [Scenedesmus sp. NREL 46B-D3]
MRDALQLEPENTDILDAHGALLAELGRVEEAVQELQKAAALSPDTGFEKYMYLGQLLQGEEAVAATQKGVELLQLDVERSRQAGHASKGPSKQLAAALCSLAEMKMSQAEDMAAVAGDSERLLQQARSADPGSPEPLQALASLRYEQGSPEEALQLLKQSMKLWFRQQGSSDDEDDDDDDGGDGEEEVPPAEAAAAEFAKLKKPTTMSEDMDEEQQQQQLEGSEEDDWEDEDEDDVPSYEFRFECAKMLLELDDSTETAIQVLEDLLAENDSVLDVWHLLGLSYYSGGMLKEAEEICNLGLQLLHKQHVSPEEDIAMSFQDLQSAIQEAKAAVGGEDA